jgi:hypothetical protein
LKNSIDFRFQDFDKFFRKAEAKFTANYRQKRLKSLASGRL